MPDRTDQVHELAARELRDGGEELLTVARSNLELVRQIASQTEGRRIPDDVAAILRDMLQQRLEHAVVHLEICEILYELGGLTDETRPPHLPRSVLLLDAITTTRRAHDAIVRRVERMAGDA